MDDNYESKKRILKIVGICLLAVGVIFIIVGAINMGNFSSNLFVMFPIGLFASGIGGMLLMFAFRREIMKHQAKDYAPILKELKQEVMPDSNVVVCSDCGTANELGSKFCKECGKSLRKTCPYCNAEVNNDSKYCNKCGRAL